MAITRVQNQVSFTQKRLLEPQANSVAMEHFLLPQLHYMNCDDIPDTVNMIRPEAGQGRLLSNNPIASLGRFFANRYYDIKSVYKGYTGTANDHQLGRTNDVGLLLGGVSIASFLSTKRITALPKRMEFVGLASFLTSMALWPKIGVFGPARIVHGFDVDKRYIDDQGRNKSVFQEPNYVPFDLYRGKNKSEDLSAIADYMGIEKNVKNRDEITKDQMRKIAVQNHTLWMWSSGSAVPTMTALLCNRFEHYYQPYLEKMQAKDARISMDALFSIIAGDGSRFGTPDPKDQKLADKTLEKLGAKLGQYDHVVKTIDNFTNISNLKGVKVITHEELTNFINTLAKDAPEGTAEAIAKDLSAILDMGDNVVADKHFNETLAKNIEAKYSGHKIMKNGIVSLSEIEQIANEIKDANNGTINKKDLMERIALKGKAKIAAVSTNARDAKIQELFAKDIMANTDKLVPKSYSYILDSQKATTIKELAIPLNSYIAKFKSIKEVNLKQMGDIADSQNSYYWGKLEKKITELTCKEIPFSKLKGLMDNKDAVRDIMKNSFEKIASDENSFKEFLTQINEIKLAYLKNMLGEGAEHEYVDLILGKNDGGGTNWNKRTFSANGTHIDKFIEMQSKISTELNNALNSTSLNGKFNNLQQYVYKDNYWKSVTAYEVSENVSKIENFVTVCDKILHSIDVYRRAELYRLSGDNELVGGFRNRNVNLDWVNDLFEQAKTETIGAHSGDIYAKFGTRDKVRRFQSYMNLIYAPINDNGAKAASAKGEGYISKLTAETLDNKSTQTLRHWINKFRNIVGDDPKNWFYQQFKAGSCSEYDGMLKTAEARYRVQGKNLVELVEQGIKKSHNSEKWLRTFSGLFVGVFSASVLAQFFFGHKDPTIPRRRKHHHHHHEINNNAIQNKTAKEIEVQHAN